MPPEHRVYSERRKSQPALSDKHAQIFVWSGGGSKHTLYKSWKYICSGNSRKMIYLLLLCTLLLSHIPVTKAECTEASDCHPPTRELFTIGDPKTTIDVSSTCGDNGTSTEYRMSSLTFDDRVFNCNDTSPHPKEYIGDEGDQDITFEGFNYRNPNFTTYWQSENTIINNDDIPREEYVIVNLTGNFLLRQIKVVFKSPHLTKNQNADMRPRAMSMDIMREGFGDNEWLSLRYFSSNCTRRNGELQVQEEDGPSFSAITPVCIEKYYQGDDETFTGWDYGDEQVDFKPAYEFGLEYASSYDIQTHFIATAVRLSLFLPSDYAPLRSYYAIADVEIVGHCACYGHAEECTGENKDQCICSHNTQGSNCEECQPLFNNKPWRVGALGQSNACEDCGCNGHAVSCQYDEVKEYGVCDNCTDDTTGDKCQFCNQFFYVNPDKELYNDTDSVPDCSGFNGTDTITYPCDRWCIPCNCSLDGTIESHDYSCENSTGQCDCKTYVMGRTCDVCMDEYWNLNITNPDGCQACDCVRPGTFNNTNMCDKISGQCICKNHTQAPTCGECKDEYFDLSESNPEGCSPCNCDPGGSTSLICPKDTGQCPCRDNIGGRTCAEPVNGYFSPPLDQLLVEAEFADLGVNGTDIFEVVEVAGHGDLNSTVTGLGYLSMPEDSTINLTITVPSSNPYKLVLRYRSDTAAWSAVQVVLSANSTELNGEVVECFDRNSTVADITYTTNVLANEKGAVEIAGDACLRGSTAYTVSISPGTSTPSGERLLVDSMVLLPTKESLSVYTNGSAETKAAIDACYEASLSVQLDLKANLSCMQYEYSLTAELYGGGIACECLPEGSSSLTCDPMGGQCPCKPNVMLQDCSMCKVDHYGFSTGDGCTACNCNIMGSVRTACNESGICECKDNVTGIKCNSCIEEHFGLFTGSGCGPCQCNLNYSMHNACEDSGQCECKPGVGGIHCTECADGFFNLTHHGCTPCDCNADGSTAEACNKETGECFCRDNAEGAKCDTCKQGYFGLGQWGPDGCIACFCSGHSDNCTTAGDWYAVEYRNNWDLLEGDTAIQDRWTGIDDEGNVVQVDAKTQISADRSQYVMRIENTEDNLARETYYFVATDQFLGQKQGAYGRSFELAMLYRYPTPGPNETVVLLNSTAGDVIMKGAHTYFTLVHMLDHTPSPEGDAYVFRFNESDWTVNSTDGVNPTYIQMQQTLSSIEYIWVRAKFTNMSGAVTDLYAASMQYAEFNSTDEDAVLTTNIEQCVCDEGFAGQFCELCAPGYKRNTPNGGAFSSCVLCECNGHGIGDVPCDPETGVCTCTHNATGDHCDVCLDGFYGDPTRQTPDDCKPCLCPGNVVQGATNVFASTCELTDTGSHKCINCTEGHGGDMCEFCVTDWYGVPEDPLNSGGACTACLCNGRADTCNTTTGMCIDCRNNTAGKECEICAPKYYGDAFAYTCQECDCTSAGSTGFCDHRTGQCECKPNVQGTYCDECMANSYNYSSGEGCYDCDCHPVGAYGENCNVTTGDCYCRDHVSGRQCDLCEDTFWNITSAGCRPCQCTAEGTIDEAAKGLTFGTCDLVTGQCECARPGIIGRTCDYCAKGTKVEFQYVVGIFVGVYPECELCGECYDNWAKKIDDIGIAIQAQYDYTIQLWNYYDNLTYDDVNPILTEMRENLTSVNSSIAMATEMVSKLNYVQDGFLQVISDITIYADNMTTIEAHLATVSAKLMTSTQFDGNIQVTPTTAIATSTLKNTTGEMALTIQRLIDDGTSSWNSIQNMTTLVSGSEQMLSDLQNRVDAALITLTKATEMKTQAEEFINGDYTTQNIQNKVALGDLTLPVNAFPGTVDTVSSNIALANTDNTEANTTTYATDGLIDERSVQMQAELERAQVAKFNVTEAEKSALTAQSASSSFMSLALAAKSNMTKALEDTVLGYQTKDYFTSTIAEGTQMATDIALSIQIPPLSDMETTAAAINATSVPQATVDAVYAKAADGLVIAEEALNITKQAEDEAQVALEEVRTIQSNLEGATQNQGDTVAILDASNNYNTTATQDIAASVTISTSAKELAVTTNTTINSILGYIASITQCYTDTTARVTSAAVTLGQADNMTDVTEQTHSSNANTISEMGTNTTTLKTAVDQSNADLMTIQRDLDTMESDLATVKALTDLRDLQAEFHNQLNEMNILRNELGPLETELDQLLNSLSSLDPEEALCRHS